LARYARTYPGKDKLNALLWLDIHTYLCDDILLMTDRMSSANALEVRVPFLDHKLVEMMFTVPFSYKLPGKDKKHMLKKYLMQHLPRDLVNRPKQGFGIPLQVWIKDRLKDFFAGLFEGDLARKEDFISMDLAREMLKQHTEQGIDHTARIWMAAHYLLWKKTFSIS
jgi:asparagine synthase (glutamine-hydrolysing)